jgi:hypothetical protein
MSIRISWTLGAVLLWAAGTAQGQETVVVLPGQTLTGISQELYGTPNRWADLCEANRETIGNDCDYLRVGVSLNVPIDEPTASTSTSAEPADLQASPLDQAVGPTPSEPPVTSVAGPIDLSTPGWVIYGATLVDGTPPSVKSEISLLRAAVYDPEAKVWLAGPSDYEITATGRQELAFATGSNTRAIRIYPLRGRDNARWVYLRLDGFEPSTNYIFEWSVSENNEAYTVSNITVRASAE